MEWRRVDNREHLRTGFTRQPRRLFVPGVLADQQAYAHTLATVSDLENTHAITWHKIPALVEHLVIRQFPLVVGVQARAFEEHAGGIEALLDRYRPGAAVATHRMPHHNRQPL